MNTLSSLCTPSISMLTRLLKFRPDLLLDLQKRTELLISLISIFEMQGSQKFKIYFSQNIKIKERFALKKAKLPRD